MQPSIVTLRLEWLLKGLTQFHEVTAAEDRYGHSADADGVVGRGCLEWIPYEHASHRRAFGRCSIATLLPPIA
jgi:hypothetical protein